MKSPKNKRSDRSKWIYLFVFIIIISSLGYVFLSKDKDSQDPIKEPIVTDKIEVEKDSLIQIIPDEQTEFFSKEEGKALLWYAMVNDSIVFYKNKGKHPVTGADLLPVTEEIIKKYQEAQKPTKEEVAKVDTRTYKVNDMKIIKKKEKPVVVEKKVKRETIWNTSLENSKDRDEVSLFVFDENDQIDKALTKRLKEEFIKREYFITDNIIYHSEMTPEIASHLKSSNVQYFEGNLKKYTDFICIGIVKYTYKENAYRNDLLDCTMSIEYFIYDAATAQQMFSEKDKLIGSDQTKKGARREAIKKFIL